MKTQHYERSTYSKGCSGSGNPRKTKTSAGSRSNFGSILTSTLNYYGGDDYGCGGGYSFSGGGCSFSGGDCGGGGGD